MIERRTAMVTLPKGVAHVSYRGGGCFLPVQTPYGRELLVEYVADLVRVKGIVQVLIDDVRWLVQTCAGRPAASCTHCTETLKVRCDHEEASRLCMRCAFRAFDLSRDLPIERRHAS